MTFKGPFQPKLFFDSIRQAKEILNMIAKSKLNTNGEAKCSLDCTSKDTEGTSPEEGAGGYNLSVLRMAMVTSQR